MLSSREISKSPASFDKRKNADWSEADLTPGRQENIGMRPAVKTDAEGIWFQQPMNFTVGRKHPTRIGITLNRLPVAAPPSGI